MRFDCFGTRCGVWGAGAADAHRQLEDWHTQFTRFAPTSELSRLNANPRSLVPVSPTMARLLIAIRDAADATGGLVDGTLVTEIEQSGYVGELECRLPLDVALTIAPPRTPARPRLTPGFTLLRAGEKHLVRRPPGLKFDSGGLAKGLFADLIAERMRGDFAVDCGGDLRFGGRSRRLEVSDPFGGPVLHVFEVTDGAAATSGIGKRSWLGADGRPAHHLLDPSTGRPAFTGVVQATALAPTAVEAEWRAKAAVLSADATWLEPHGGVLVGDDGSHQIHHPQGEDHEEKADRGLWRRFAGSDQRHATTAGARRNELQRARD